MLLCHLLPKANQPKRIIVIMSFHWLVYWQSHVRHLHLSSKVCALTTDCYRNDCYTVLILGCSTPAVTMFSRHYSKPTTKNICANIQSTVSDTIHSVYPCHYPKHSFINSKYNVCTSNHENISEPAHTMYVPVTTALSQNQHVPCLYT
jgi:hypothetical protein